LILIIINIIDDDDMLLFFCFDLLGKVTVEVPPEAWSNWLLHNSSCRVPYLSISWIWLQICLRDIS